MLRLRTLAALLVGPLCALLIGELALRNARDYWELMRSWETGTSAAVEAEARLAAPERVRCVILGSSIALSDLDEHMLDRLTGAPEGSTVNLGIKGEAVVVSAMLLPEVLALTPDTVILVVHSQSMADTPRRWRRGGARGRGVPPSTIYSPAVALHVFDARSFLVDRGYHLAGMLGATSVVVRHRHDLRYLASRLLLHRGRGPGNHHPRSWARLDGARLRRAIEGARVPLHFSLDSPNARAVGFLARTLAARGVRFVVAPAPDNPAVRGVAFIDELTRQLAALQASYGFELVEPEAFPEFDEKEFVDHHHLLPPGQAAFTTTVAHYLQVDG